MADGPNKTTMPVREMREILGLGKTDSYWLLKKEFFDVVLVNGKMRVVIESFEQWYANQVKYSKVNGPPPGEQLKQKSYSITDLTAILDVSDTTIYDLIKKGCFQTELVDYRTRVPKQSFDQWYASQSRYQTPADREKNRKLKEASISMPEMARMLGVTRESVYAIIHRDRDAFEFVIIADRKRITKKSFQAWLHSREEKKRSQPVEPQPTETVKVESAPKEAPPVKEKPVEVRLDKPSYSVKEAAILLELSQKVVYRMVQSGDLKALALDRQIRIRREEIFHWLYDRKSQSKLRGEN